MPRRTFPIAALALTSLVACTHHHGSSGIPGPPSPGTVTQALWVANGTSVVEFLPAQIAAGGNQTPHLINANTLFGAVQGVAFDAAGNLWVVDAGTLASQGAARPALYEFSPSQLSGLAANQSPVPARTIQFSGFIFPQQITFDASGNLWVSDSGSETVSEYTPSQLTAGGFNLTPNVQISSNPPFSSAIGLAFSPAGNLWVANDGGTTLEEFDASALPTAFGSTARLAPRVTLHTSGQSIEAPWALAFDKAGNLWSSNTNSSDAVVRFAASSLGASGSPSVLAITSTSFNGNPTLVTPTGIAFDSGSDLAVVSGSQPFGIAFYLAAQLGAGGALAPHQSIVGFNTTVVAPAGITFGPAVI